MDKNTLRKALAASLMILFLSLEFAGQGATAYPLSMPEEYVNYTISRVDGVLWAKIDGTYPINYSGTEESILMVYPTPPGTTNISVILDGVSLDWYNFTDAYPENLHHTAIGNWSMISTLLEPASNRFVLKIHYEHPVEIINGTYAFLYDLNISPYLSASDNQSICHFTIRMEIEYADLKVNTVFGANETLRPIEYSESTENPIAIKIDEVSEYEKPLPGDLLVTFVMAETEYKEGILYVLALVLSALGLTIAILVAHGLIRRRKNAERPDQVFEWF